MTAIAKKLKKIQSSLPNNVEMVVVTKTRSPKEIDQAISAGAKKIGENRVQEAEEKFSTIKQIKHVERRLIGQLQSNKAKKAVKIFDTIDSVGTEKLAKKISEAAKKIQKIQRVLIQVNSSGEEAKSGFSLLDKEKIIKCAQNKNIKIEGLMTMGPNTRNEKDIKRAFEKTKELFEEINKETNFDMKTLSIGMSGDYKIAIKEGSTLIRVGTAIFGERNRLV
tara:strand:+ start:9341 stop:10006 length:666 start_codon:yes stop_codon:yes gene_type:complete